MYTNEEMENQGASQQQFEEQPQEAYESPEEEVPQESAPEEQAFEPEQPKKKKHNIGQRLSEVQREKFQALDALRRAQEENDRLRGLADNSTRTALNHYDDAVNQRLHAAKEKKRKSLESGDIDAQTDADVELGLATAEYQEANRLKAQQQMYDQQQHGQQYNYQQQDPRSNSNYTDPNVAYLAQEFVNENPWFSPHSEDYDADMAGTMHALCNEFDNNLRRAGMGNQIMTPEYFSVVRQRAQELMNHRKQPMGGDLNMRQTRSSVAPVRQGGFASQGQGYPRQTGLSAEEKEIARNLRIDEKTYLQYRLKDERENAHKRVRR
jgi:hypothetical protein